MQYQKTVKSSSNLIASYLLALACLVTVVGCKGEKTSAGQDSQENKKLDGEEAPSSPFKLTILDQSFKDTNGRGTWVKLRIENTSEEAVNLTEYYFNESLNPTEFYQNKPVENKYMVLYDLLNTMGKRVGVQNNKPWGTKEVGFPMKLDSIFKDPQMLASTTLQPGHAKDVECRVAMRCATNLKKADLVFKVLDSNKEKELATSPIVKWEIDPAYGNVTILRAFLHFDIKPSKFQNDKGVEKDSVTVTIQNKGIYVFAMNSVEIVKKKKGPFGPKIVRLGDCVPELIYPGQFLIYEYPNRTLKQEEKVYARFKYHNSFKDEDIKWQEVVNKYNK